MAKARPRYICTGNVKFNDHDLKGVKFIRIRECTGSGRYKTDDKGRIYKRDLDHVLLRFDDLKFAKQNKLPSEWLMSKPSLERFFSLVESA